MSYKEYLTNKQFCPLPWTSFYIWPNGEVDNCCISTNKLGNIRDSSISEVLNSPKAIKIKSDMLNGISPDGCKRCYPNQLTVNDDNFNYKNTNRGNALNDLAMYNKEVYSDPNAFNYRYADLRFRNTCNFACVYCGPELSSSWAQELNEPNRISDEKINQLNRYFLDNVHNIKILYLAGGEPLLIKENLKLLETLYEVNPECDVRISTNLSMIKNNPIFEQLLKFKNSSWWVSAEDSHERFNYIRYGGDWNIFYENLLFLKSKTDRIFLNAVYTVLNANTIFDFVRLMESIGFEKNHIKIQFVNGGHYIHSGVDPRTLPDEYVNSLITKIEFEITGMSNYDQQLQFILQCLKTTIPNRKNPKDVFDYLKELDQRRNLDSRKVFPDIYEYCN
jgi:radical SAM protein with 4Fe4S-binding SPASM domain